MKRKEVGFLGNNRRRYSRLHHLVVFSVNRCLIRQVQRLSQSEYRATGRTYLAVARAVAMDDSRGSAEVALGQSRVTISRSKLSREPPVTIAGNNKPRGEQEKRSNERVFAADYVQCVPCPTAPCTCPCSHIMRRHSKCPSVFFQALAHCHGGLFPFLGSRVRPILPRGSTFHVSAALLSSFILFDSLKRRYVHLPFTIASTIIRPSVFRSAPTLFHALLDLW
jgi:hypothetical protein